VQDGEAEGPAGPFRAADLLAKPDPEERFVVDVGLPVDDVEDARLLPLDGGGRGTSTRPLFEAGSNLRPRTLISGIRLKIGQPSVKKKRTFLGCNRNVVFRERVPQPLNQVQPLAWA